jgi:hypothetical protein
MNAADVDWKAAADVAAGLGRRTLLLVADRDADGLQAWCLQMASVRGGESDTLRSLSYSELAVLLGHGAQVIEDDARLEWAELLQRTQQLAAVVKAKAKAEEAARAQAEAEAKAVEEAARVEAEPAAGEEGAA